MTPRERWLAEIEAQLAQKLAMPRPTAVLPVKLIALTPGTVATPPSMRVPGRSGRSVSRIAIGTPAPRHGPIERGCSTLAPVVAISCASA